MRDAQAERLLAVPLDEIDGVTVDQIGRIADFVAAHATMPPVMFVVVIFAARFIVQRFCLPPFWAVRAAVGAIALALLIGAELLLAAALQGGSVGQYIASRDPVSGTVYLAALILLAAMPSILMRLNGPSLSSG